MKNYNVMLDYTTGGEEKTLLFIEVEATSEDDAIDKMKTEQAVNGRSTFNGYAELSF